MAVMLALLIQVAEMVRVVAVPRVEQEGALIHKVSLEMFLVQEEMVDQ
jgi:hypothetical protein